MLGATSMRPVILGVIRPLRPDGITSGSIPTSLNPYNSNILYSWSYIHIQLSRMEQRGIQSGIDGSEPSLPRYWVQFLCEMVTRPRHHRHHPESGVMWQNCRMPPVPVSCDPGGLTLWVSKTGAPRATHFPNFPRKPTSSSIILEIFCFLKIQ